MFEEKRRRWIPISIAVLGFIWTLPQAVLGQQDVAGMPEHHLGYTVQSLRGNYAAIATYGGNAARALGVQVFDGAGNLKGSAIVNQPGPDGTRSVVSISFTGTYTVNGDGTGVMSLTITLPNGTTADATEDFVITKAKLRDRVLIATEVIDAQEQPSTVIPGGVFVTHTYTRRPE
jgi:hypothetical protein